MLEDGEFVETNKCYRGEYYYVRIPVNFEDDKELHAKEQVCARHETVNRCFKQFGVLKQVFQHNIGVNVTIKSHKYVA